MRPPKISLDYWTALISVVESGSYAKAGERMHKSQSTLTYAIQKMEDLLGVKVFEIQGRKAVLTPTGELLYRRGKALLEDAARLEHAAGELAQGWEPEIRLAVDVIFPTWLLLRCLAQFSGERPETRIELIETVLGGTEEALAERKADFAIGSIVPPGFLGDVLLPVRFVCVAAPSHPLHALGRELTLEDLRPHRHLVIRDSGVQRARAAGWLNELRWTVSHKATSIRAAVMGLGYAWYPEESIREELDSGALRALALREGAERFTTLYLVYADRDAAGPGTRRLAQIIREETKAACQPNAQRG
ncbi:MAG: LysR family transcriptional regulator [Betaproteobacteria bacterium RIFCSPLOWO2_12_FULL_65_14]|nr:MAG: LysR family transcriptional regulator [Betaproteobacteria bacterium RIFCSPLOWO2_12_FULL_65_14]